MLKKQTVWLLTMLSLMIVLSVYYVMIDKDDRQAYIDTGETDKPATTETADDNNNNDDGDGNEGLTDSNNDEGENQTEGLNDNTPDVSDFTNLGQDDMFTMFRMELENERSKKEGYLNDILKSASATTDEKNDALNNINKIDETKTKEFILQNTIMSSADKYKDVLVRAEEEMIFVHVMTDELSKEEAVDIMQLVRDEFGEIPVDVRFK